MKTRIVIVLIAGCLLFPLLNPIDAAALDIPRGKQTVLGLYITAREACEQWQENQNGIQILDVRTPEEYIFVGHAPMARNIPVGLVNQRQTAERKKLAMEANPNFLAGVKRYYRPGDKIFVMCRSGGRSAGAVNLLAQAGYKKVYNVIDGFEGDSVKDKNSYFNGKRVKNGWKNSGAPWTYTLDPQLMYAD